MLLSYLRHWQSKHNISRGFKTKIIKTVVTTKGLTQEEQRGDPPAQEVQEMHRTC